MSIPAATATARRPADWLSILQLTISVLAALFFFGRALVVGTMGLLTLTGSDSSAALSQFVTAAQRYTHRHIGAAISRAGPVDPAKPS